VRGDLGDVTPDELEERSFGAFFDVHTLATWGLWWTGRAPRMQLRPGRKAR
jgi:hypothetical protein